MAFSMSAQLNQAHEEAALVKAKQQNQASQAIVAACCGNAKTSIAKGIQNRAARCAKEAARPAECQRSMLKLAQVSTTCENFS